MTSPPKTLNQLRAERDIALQRATDGVTVAKARVRSLDTDVRAFATNHPLMAIGGVAAIGAVAGVLVSSRTVRTMAKAAAIVVLKPLAMDALHRFTQQFGEDQQVND